MSEFEKYRKVIFDTLLSKIEKKEYVAPNSYADARIYVTRPVLEREVGSLLEVYDKEGHLQVKPEFYIKENDLIVSMENSKGRYVTDDRGNKIRLLVNKDKMQKDYKQVGNAENRKYVKDPKTTLCYLINNLLTEEDFEDKNISNVLKTIKVFSLPCKFETSFEEQIQDWKKVGAKVLTPCKYEDVKGYEPCDTHGTFKSSDNRRSFGQNIIESNSIVVK